MYCYRIKNVTVINYGVVRFGFGKVIAALICIINNGYSIYYKRLDGTPA